MNNFLVYVNAVKVIRKLNLEAKENGQKEIQIHAETLLNIAVLRYKKG